jgi:hypothetical protein
MVGQEGKEKDSCGMYERQDSCRVLYPLQQSMNVVVDR